jgi:hypothetical protein
MNKWLAIVLIKLILSKSKFEVIIIFRPSIKSLGNKEKWTLVNSNLGRTYIQNITITNMILNKFLCEIMPFNGILGKQNFSLILSLFSYEKIFIISMKQTFIQIKFKLYGNEIEKIFFCFLMNLMK